MSFRPAAPLRLSQLRSAHSLRFLRGAGTALRAFAHPSLLIFYFLGGFNKPPNPPRPPNDAIERSPRPSNNASKSDEGGAGGGGGPICRFLSIHSQIHCGCHPLRSAKSSFTIRIESDSPIAGFKLYRKSLAGRAVQTIQQLNE